ncbi:MAG: hypothetical protein QNJ74_10275 [Trichodesmium sp. MO_231.B1]|nr:hypothetical protein [Trichodesmium sp. MO_231.B1]
MTKQKLNQRDNQRRGTQKAVPNVFDHGIEGVVVHPVRVKLAK